MEPKSVFTGVRLQPRTFCSPLLHSHRCQIFLTLTRRQTVIKQQQESQERGSWEGWIDIIMAKKLLFFTWLGWVIGGYTKHMIPENSVAVFAFVFWSLRSYKMLLFCFIIPQVYQLRIWVAWVENERKSNAYLLILDSVLYCCREKKGWCAHRGDTCGSQWETVAADCK